MSYIVFARKWRPQTFDDVIGQEHITTTLKNAIKQERVAHAYLFCGPRGIGKTTTARILAKALNCEKGPTPTPCNKCISCKEITEGRGLDIIEIDGASNRGIDEIRNLRENVKFAPQQGRFKIYIIDEVHMLTQEAFNALLKTLEEPPRHVKFIFATTAPYKVIPTILSRCQRFNFHRIATQDIVKKLKKITDEEKIKAEEAALFTIARAASASIRDAESLLDQLATYCKNNITAADVNRVLGAIENETLYDFTQYIINKDTPGALRLINRIIDEGIEHHQFLLSLMEYFRAAMIMKEGKDMAQFLDLPPDEIERISKQTEPLSIEDILYILYTILNTNQAMRRASSQRIPLEIMTVKLSQKESIVSLAEIMQRLTALEKESKENARPSAAQAEPKPLPAGDSIKESSPAAEAEPLSSDEETPASTPPLSGLLDSQTALYRIREVMPQVIKDIKQEKIYIASCLNEGKLVRLKDNTLLIGFLKKNNFHKESLEKPQNKRLIEGHLSKALGANIILEFVILKDEDETAPSGENNLKESKEEKSPLKKALSDPIIKTALDIFDGNIMKFM